VTLFDCGPGTIRALAESGLGVGDVERVCVSHFHPDHCLDLFALAFARRNPNLRSAGLPRLEIVGPTGIAAILDRGEALFGERGWTRFEDTLVVEIDPKDMREVLERDEFELRWQATGHAPEAVAWRIDGRDGTSIAYSGDTGENPAVAKLARDVDLFVCECSFPDDHAVARHLTPSGAARLASLARCKRLVLTHFYPGLEPEDAASVARRSFAGVIEVPRDGSSYRTESG
jgi:ribonuclease BN (tRNA processing enzyme)